MRFVKLIKNEIAFKKSLIINLEKNHINSMWFEIKLLLGK